MLGAERCVKFTGGSAALTFLGLAGEFLDRSGQGRLEVEQLGSGRYDDGPDHVVDVHRSQTGLELGPLLGRHTVGAVHLEVPVRYVIHGVEFGLPADEQDVRRVYLGVDWLARRPDSS